MPTSKRFVLFGHFRSSHFRLFSHELSMTTVQLQVKEFYWPHAAVLSDYNSEINNQMFELER